MDRHIMAQTVEGMTDREILSALYLDMHDVKQDIEIIKSDNSKLKKVVYGNGEVGLLERHNTLTNRVDAITKGIVWGLSAFGLLVMGLLWGIFIGTIQVTVK